jgi:hypothetical protein
MGRCVVAPFSAGSSTTTIVMLRKGKPERLRGFPERPPSDERF